MPGPLGQFFPGGSRSPTAVPMYDTYPFARMVQLGAGFTDDGPCDLRVQWQPKCDYVISAIAALGAFRPGDRLVLVSNNRDQADVDANYLEHLWPRHFALSVNVPVSHSEELIIRAPGKAAVVLIGKEHRDVR